MQAFVFFVAAMIPCLYIYGFICLFSLQLSFAQKEHHNKWKYVVSLSPSHLSHHRSLTMPKVSVKRIGMFYLKIVLNSCKAAHGKYNSQCNVIIGNKPFPLLCHLASSYKTCSLMTPVLEQGADQQLLVARSG